jgi:hypothetical protein
MTLPEQRLQEARDALRAIDQGMNAVPLYVASGEDPYTALQKIRDYLAGFIDGNSGGIALGVACLERVIFTLHEYEARTVYERKRGA